MKTDARTVKLSTDVSLFDEKILRVLDKNPIDGKPAREWLSDPKSPPQQVACLLNILAKIRTVPSELSPIIDFVNEIIRVREERVYFTADVKLMGKLQNLAADPEMPFYAEGFPKAKIHQELFDTIEKLGLGSRMAYSLWSFRQEGRYCLQVVIAAPWMSSSQCCIDCDIDLGNPLQDVEGIIIHLDELKDGVTDAMKLRDHLLDSPVGPYLNYNVEEGKNV